MKTLHELLMGMEYQCLQGDLETEISDVIYDSRKDCDKALFVCISGTKIDAHEFIPEVCKKGASPLVVERPVQVSENIPIILVEDARLALAYLSAAYFDHPTRKLTTIGITGTKGKTTSTHMLKAILEQDGHQVGLIGTNGAIIGNQHYPTANTTPESYELQRYFHQMREAGCDTMIMEVSSQGLKMNRVAGISFDVGIFTNITPDHIGPAEHADFDEYLTCKGKLFSLCKVGMVNGDDPHYKDVIKNSHCRIKTFGCRGELDFHATQIMPTKRGNFMGITFQMNGENTFPVEVAIPGLFSVYNALAAVSAALILGVKETAIQNALSAVRVDGRMELVYASEQCTVLVDYAHNGVSAESLLTTLRQYQPKRLVVVYGCGGNRDPHRRYEMGEVTGRLADLSIITADNSRWEKVEDIIRDIHIGLDPTGGKFIDIPDRQEAIRYSIDHAEAGDVIAIIGKGHEDYQEIQGKKTYFLDREEAQKILKEKGYLS